MHTAEGMKIWFSVQSRNFGCDKNFHDTIPRVNKIPIINDKLNGSKWFETQSHIIGRVYFMMFTNVYDVNIPNHSNYNHTFCECLMYTLDAKLLIQQEKINLLLSEFPASILDGVIVVLLWGIFSGFNWASTLLIRCFICRAFSQRMKEHNINSINLYILHDKISTTQLVDYALKPSDYPQPLWAQPPDTFIGNKSNSS